MPLLNPHNIPSRGDFPCPRCEETLTVDGYGDYLHRDTGTYHCADGHYVGVLELKAQAEKNDNST